MRASGKLTTAIFFAGALASCLPACATSPTRRLQGQVLLYFDTDAPLPAAPDQVPGQIAPLFDSLRVDVYPPGASVPCDACTNEFEVDTEQFQQRQASVGIALPPGSSGYVARARLFVARFADASGDPDAYSTIDVTVALPAVVEGVVTSLTIVLPTDTVGVPVGSLDAPVQPPVGPPAGSQVGSWSGAQPVDCAGPPLAGEVCVPGGAYWMGYPGAPGDLFNTYRPEPRLVVLSPFFLRSTEVTVGALRAANERPRMIWSGSHAGTSDADWCTFTANPGPNEALPVSCLSWREARTYCNSIGADLPTEAQYEYVAGGLVGRIYPWGGDEPDCGDSVFGRAGWGIYGTLYAPCKPSTAAGGGPEPTGTGARDHVDLPGGTIYDLAGNVNEWALDEWNRLDEPCWARPGVYDDPLCTMPSPADGTMATARGAGWSDDPAGTKASYRSPQDPSGLSETGFRCARSAL